MNIRPKANSPLFVLAAVVSTVAGAADRLVVRDDFGVPEGWNVRTVAGRDFAPVLFSAYWLLDRGRTCPDLPLYNEAIDYIPGRRKLGLNDIVSAKSLEAYAMPLAEEERRTTPYAFRDLFEPEYWKALDDGLSRGNSCFIKLKGDRPAYFLKDAYPLADRASYRAWRESHPNCLGVRTLGEFDSQTIWYEAFGRNVADTNVRARLLRDFPWPPPGTPASVCTRDWWPKWARTCFEREKAYYFGEDRIWTLHSGCPSLGPIMADLGACGFLYEATPQGPGSWTVPGAFSRGAARQFGVPFGWYGANWTTGFTRGGEKKSGEHSTWLDPHPGFAFMRDGGASRSLIRRQFAYGWLIGASLFEPENWYHYHMEEYEKGKFRPSAYAQDLNDLYVKSKTEDRGVSYTPVALLMPTYERFSRKLWNPDNCDPWSANAFFLTLEPMEASDAMCTDRRKRGDESCFFNSPFGGIYDVVCPDANRTRGTIGRTLAAYKAAFVVGDFRPSELPPRLFEDYAAQGGTLFTDAEKLRTGVVDPAAAGVRFGSEKTSGGTTLTDAASGREVSKLTGPYSFYRPDGTPSAKPLLTDGNGTVVAWVHDFGKGRIVTVACDRMLPDDYLACTRKQYTSFVNEATSGRRTFDIIRTLLARVQRETMPVSVDGDVQWGVNKVEKLKGGKVERSWLVWLFNNKGVTKFIGEPEELDTAKTARVTVRCGKETKTVEVPPGGIRFVGFPAEERMSLRLADATVVWNPATGFDREAPERMRAGLADLTNTLAHVTGRVPCVFAEGTEPKDASNVIYFGDTQAARAAGADGTDLRRGDWRLRTEPGRAYVYAKGSTGAAFAATDFVERYCGYWFLTPEGDDPFEFDPGRTVPCADVTVRPALYKRGIYTSRYGEWSDFARRRRVAEFDSEIEGKYRVSYNVRNDQGKTTLCHSSFCYLPPSKHFKDHPEWYSLINGRRQYAPVGQICMSNPEARAECLRSLLTFVERDRREFPKDYPTIYDFTHQDGSDRLCECEACRRTIAKYNRVPGGHAEGGDAGLQLEFVNWIAAEAAKRYPDVQLRTFAYWTTECAPKPGTIRPAPNVNIWWCDCYSISDHTRPLEEKGSFNARQVAKISDWCRLTDNVTVWDYMLYGGFQGTSDYPEWSPDAIAADAKLFRSLGLTRVSMESEIFRRIQPLYELNYYLLSLCYIDPDTDVDAALDRYCRVYGRGRAKIAEALQFLRRVVRENPPVDDRAWHARVLAWRTRENWERFIAPVRAAYDLAERDAERARIARVLASAYHELVALILRTAGTPGLDRAKAEFVRFGGEWARETLDVMLLRFDDLPPEFATAARDDVKCIDWHIIGEDAPNARWAADPESTVGKARAWKLGKPDDEHRPGFPIPCGVYDFQTKDAYTFSLSREDVKPVEGKYVWVKLGRARIGSNSLVWMQKDWHLGSTLRDFYIGADGAADDPNWFDVYASLKFTGPAYFPGSKLKNGVWSDRFALLRVRAR